MNEMILTVTVFFVAAQTLAWRRKVDRVTANHYLSLTASQETSNIFKRLCSYLISLAFLFHRPGLDNWLVNHV